jgi:uncharacterized protein YndB with AHSA1/START domain
MEDAIVIEIDIAAPPERVFSALTDPEQLAMWWTEGGTKNWEVDLRVGGKWRAEGFDVTCGEWQLTGQITAVAPPRLLEYTWEEQVQYRQSAPLTTVRYELERITTGTRLRLTHKGFGDRREAQDEYRGGWPGVLDQLRLHFQP